MIALAKKEKRGHNRAMLRQLRKKDPSMRGSASLGRFPTNRMERDQNTRHRQGMILIRSTSRKEQRSSVGVS